MGSVGSCHHGAIQVEIVGVGDVYVVEASAAQCSFTGWNEHFGVDFG